MFDPVIQLNYHVALLHMRDALAGEMNNHRGLMRSAIQGVGKMVMTEIRQSKESMRLNKMWIAEMPMPDGRYRYSCMGQSSSHEITPTVLEFYQNMVMGDIGKKLEAMRRAEI